MKLLNLSSSPTPFDARLSPGHREERQPSSTRRQKRGAFSSRGGMHRRRKRERGGVRERISDENFELSLRASIASFRKKETEKKNSDCLSRFFFFASFFPLQFSHPPRFAFHLSPHSPRALFFPRYRSNESIKEHKTVLSRFVSMKTS